MVEFRSSTVTDASAHELLTHYFADRARTFPPSMGEYRTAFPDPADFVSPRGEFIVVEDENGRDVGCGGIRLIDHSRGVTRFEVKHVWIEPDARGQGIGGALLAELEARALAFGASELVLDTNVAQESASRLYTRTGYVEIPAYNANPNATHWYAKNLTTELE